MSHCLMLLVDDDRDFLKLFITAAKIAGRDDQCRIMTAPSAEQALEVLANHPIDVLVTDVQMPGGMDGYALWATTQTLYPNLPVILMTAYGSVERAVAAVKEGAYHYFEKPLTGQEGVFWNVVNEAVNNKRLADELVARQHDPATEESGSLIIGSSPPVIQFLEAIAKAAPTPATILIQGETGVGKELAARAIHEQSNLADKPFVAVNCAAIAPGLLESELFGHEKGAFTGALASRAGIFERAQGGSIFLDEISELSLTAQAELLRVLDRKTFIRVGGNRERRAEFRLICASNRNLAEMVDSEAFRQDLFFRLNVYPIRIPPLRKRKEDIPQLAAHFLIRQAKRMGQPVKTISNEAMIFMHQYDWPGNIRELSNLIERGLIAAQGSEIELKDIFPMEAAAQSDEPVTSLKQMEKMMISLAMERTNGAKATAAQMLGIGLKTLYQKLDRYGLKEKK